MCALDLMCAQVEMKEIQEDAPLSVSGSGAVPAEQAEEQVCCLHEGHRTSHEHIIKHMYS